MLTIGLKRYNHVHSHWQNNSSFENISLGNDQKPYNSVHSLQNKKTGNNVNVQQYIAGWVSYSISTWGML